MEERLISSADLTDLFLEKRSPPARPLTPRDHIERIAKRKITGFLGTIDDNGEYYDSVHKQNQSLSQHIIADYHGRFLIELIQNANDAHDKLRRDGEVAMLLASDEGDAGTLYVANRGRPFGRRNVDALCEMGLSSKPPGEAVGNKGLGFRSVRHVTDAPEVFSRAVEDGPGTGFDGYRFTFARGAELDPLLPDDRRRTLAREDLPAFYIPRWIEEVPAAALGFAERGFSTVIRLPLRNAPALEVVRTEMVGLAKADAPMLLFLRRIRKLEVCIEGERLSDQAMSMVFERSEAAVADGSGPTLVDLGSSGKFWMAHTDIDESEMQAAVTHGLGSGALPQGWRGWKGAGEVALAVPLGDERPGFNPRLYTFLPMGRGANSPFRGHLHGSFFPRSNRMSLDPTVRVNALVLKHAVELASATARWLEQRSSIETDVTVPIDAAVRAAVDLLLWKTPTSLLERDAEDDADEEEENDAIDLGKAMATEIVRRWSATSLADASFVPCLGDWTGDRLARPAFGPVAWSTPTRARRPTTIGKTFSLDVVARHGAAAGIAPVWAGLGQRRSELLADFLRKHAGGRFKDRMTNIERAQVVEDLAGTLAKAKKIDCVKWTAFYQELSEFMGADAAALAGREILICQDGSLRATRAAAPMAPAPTEGATRRRRREPREAMVFMPPRRGEAEDGIGEDFYPPAPAREFFAFLHDALPWYSELASARQFLEGDLVAPFESEALLNRISQIVERDGTRKVMFACLRWAFAIWRRSVAVKRPIALNPSYRLFVPTMQGEFIRAADAVFSSAWPERTLGHQLQQFLELAPAGSTDIEDVRIRRLATPSHAVFGAKQTEAWTEFLWGLGVQRGLEPRSKETPHYVEAWRVSSFDFLKDLELPGSFGSLIRKDIEALPRIEVGLPTATKYRVGALWWMPAQADIQTFSDEALDAYARLIVEWIGRAEHQHLWMEVKHQHNYRADKRDWPTPLAAFLRSAAWVPCEEPGEVELKRSRHTGCDVWLPTGSDRYPPFLRRPSHRFARALDRAAESTMKTLRECAGFRSFNASESLLDQVDFLAKQFAEGHVRRFHERELMNVYNRCWTRLADQHAAWIAMPAVRSPGQLLARRKGQLGLAKMRGADADTVFVRDSADAIAANLVEVIGNPLFDARSNDPARVGELLRRLYPKTIRRTSELAYDIHVDGTSLGDLPVGAPLVKRCAWLRPMLAASLEALDSLESNRLPADRSGIVQLLDKIELHVKANVAFTLEGTDVTPPKSRPAYHFQRAGGEPLVIVVGEGELTWSMVEAALPVIGEAIQQSAVVPHMKLLTRQLAHEGVPVADRSLGPEDLLKLCRALELGEQAIDAARDSLGERVDRTLPWFRAIVFHHGGARALDRWLKGELAASQERTALVEHLRACLPPGKNAADDVVQAAKVSFSIGELRDRLGLEFAAFNVSLLESGSEPDVDPAGQQAQLDHYVDDNRIAITNSLRNMVASTVLGFASDARYAAARQALAGLKPNPKWLVIFERIPETELAAHLNAWLKIAGAPPLGQNPQGLAELMTVRMSNTGVLKTVVGIAQPLVRAWGIQKGQIVHEVWREQNQAEIDLRRRLEEAGAFDCRIWTKEELVSWFAHLGLWPTDMGRTLDRSELGIAETEIEAQARKDRADREQRAQGARSVYLNGTPRDPLAVDWTKLSQEIAQGLSKAVLNRPIGTFADLAPADIARRRTGSGTGGGGGGVFSGIPQDKKDMIGRLGELSVYHWLKARQPGQDIDQAWVSGNAGPFTGVPGSDGLGYDFRIAFNKQIWFIEVKASTEDPCQFEMGETEVRFARDVARSRKPVRYVIAYVANVGQTSRTTIDILPNPLSPDADGTLNIAGDSIRYTFGRRL